MLKEPDKTDSDEVKKTQVIRIYHLCLEIYIATYFVTFLAHQYQRKTMEIC